MKKIGKIHVIVKQGNIALENVDCIVIPRTQNGLPYGELANSIKSHGMENGLKAYDEIASQLPFPYGEEMVVPSGKEGIMLSNVSVIGAHTNQQFYAVAKAVLQSLTSADALGAKTVAIPELGTGDTGKFTPEQAAQVVLYGVEMFDTICVENTIQEVRLVTTGSNALAQKVLTEKSYCNIQPKKGQKKFDLYIWIKEIKKHRDEQRKKSWEETKRQE